MITSGRMPRSRRAASMPTSTAPRLAPPERTNATATGETVPADPRYLPLEDRGAWQRRSGAATMSGMCVAQLGGSVP